MTKNEIKEALNATVFTDTDGDSPEGFESACACDMMSDLLSMMNDTERPVKGVLLLSGLNNPQVIRTAEMVDIHLVVLLMGKTPPPETVELARKSGVTLMGTSYTMYKGCRLLHAAGIRDIRDAGDRVG